MKDSKYFTVDEMLVSATGERLKIKNVLPDMYKPALLNTMQKMDIIREALGHPIIVLSGFRSDELNVAVGGSKKSWHRKGQAVDFVCPKFGSPLEICKAIHLYVQKHPEVRYHELIHEYNSWVHIAFPTPGQQPMMELLTINKKGTKWGLS